MIYESTVYPGCTEEICVPILERVSGLKFNKDFFAGYSPERINPGDKEHRLPTIQQGHLRLDAGGRRVRRRAVSHDHHGRHAQGVQHPRRRGRQGHREHAARRQHRADQRAGADLQPARHRHRGSAGGRRHASGTSCRSGPGLVGGHCIGVDPYYLTHKAQEIGYHPEMILAGRRINDSMAQLRRAAGRAADDPATRIQRAGRAHPGAGPDVQGELPRPAQHEGRRRRARAREVRREGRRVRSVGRRRRGRARVRHLDPSSGCRPAATTRSCWPSRTSEFREMGIDRIRALAQEARTCSTTSSTCFRRDAGRRAGS